MARKQSSARNVTVNDPLQQLRKICLALPDTEEKIAWGEPTWRVNGRIFAMFDTHHHGAEHISVVCDAPAGAQEALLSADPEHFFRPPYVGGKGWLGIHLDNGVSLTTVAALLEQAHRTAAEKKRRAKRSRL